jgi:hypothetical protein
MHRNPKEDALSFHLGALLDALVPSMAIHRRLLTLQEI